MSNYTSNEIMEKINNGDSLRKVELSGIDLRGADLRGAILREANLEEANLLGARLDGTILEEANLTRAKLMGVSLIEAILKGADLRKTDFETANLYKVNMEYSNPHEADLEKCNLRGAHLLGANLHEADLKSADLRDADLRNVNLSSAVLNKANLSNSNITGANLWGISHVGWQIDGIVADYIYIREKENKKEDPETLKHKFEPGGFEELYKSLPTVELLFANGLNLESLMRLVQLIAIINVEHPDLGIDLQGIERAFHDVMVKLRLRRDDHLPRAANIMAKLRQKMNIEQKGQLDGMDAHSQLPVALPQLTSGNVIMNDCTINFVNSKGESQWRGSAERLTEAQHEMGPHKPISDDDLFSEYKMYKREVHELLEIIRAQLEEDKQQLLDVFKQALEKKDDNVAGIWKKLKEGVEIGTKIHGLLTTLARFLRINL